MLTFLTRLLGAAMLAACPASAAGAQTAAPSRALAVDDITALASFGRAEVSPGGRWVIYEKRAAYDTIARFEFEWRSTWTIMDLWLVDLRDPAAPPQRLLAGEGLGLQKVAWSPSGTRLLISRLRGHDFEYGVVTLADRSVRWTGLTPEVSRTGASATWLSDNEAALLVRPDHSLPAALRHQGASQGLISEAWERTALGQRPSRTVIDAQGGVFATEAVSPARALVRFDLSRNSTTTLAFGPISDFAVSPNGLHVAVVQAGEGASLSTTELVLFDGRDRQRLSFLSLDGREVSRPMEDLDVAPGLLRWSADSRALLVWARRDGQAWSEGRLLQASRRGVVAMNLGDLRMGSAEAVLGVHADWLGDTPVLYARAAGQERYDWRLLSTTAAPHTLTGSLDTTPGTISSAGENDLSLFADSGYWTMSAAGLRRLTPAGLSVRPMIASDRERVMRLRVNEAPRRPWVMAQDGQGESLVLTGADRRRLGPKAGTAEDRASRPLAASPDAVLSVRRTGLSEALHLRTATAEVQIDAVNQTFANVRLIEPKPLIHMDIRGRETRSWLLLPEGGTPVRGLIVRVYPGSTDSLVWFDPLTLTYAFVSQVPAGAGFAVLSPSIPVDGPIATRGDDIVRSVDLAVDAALAAFPQLPADRMAIMGHSFGGYAALEIAARSTRYRAYIASSAFSDMFGMWGELDPATRILPEDGGMIRATQGWTEVGQGGLAAPPWAAPEAYAASSPYLRADKISAPVLLLAADMDFVPLSQAERIYSTILRNGGRARLVTYWGEHHILWSPANIRDRFHQVFDWLDLCLTPDEPLNRLDPDAAPRSGPTLRGRPPP